MTGGLTLPPRLRTIADLVPPGARLVDVGTDHAYLPVWLLSHGKIASAIASDVVPGPLDRARQTADRYLPPELGLELRLCDGLAAIAPEEADTVVIAGMGGETIAAILEAAPWTREGALLLLQPMSRAEVLRAWLLDHGYHVSGERLVLDRGTLYTVLSASGGAGPAPLPGQLCYGWADSDDPLFPAYLDAWISKLRREEAGLARAARGRRRERLAEVREILSALEEKRCTP